MEKRGVTPEENRELTDKDKQGIKQGSAGGQSCGDDTASKLADAATKPPKRDETAKESER